MHVCHNRSACHIHVHVMWAESGHFSLGKHNVGGVTKVSEAF